MNQIELIKSKIIPVINELELKLYDVSWQNENKNKILQISFSKQDNTIDLDTCSMASDRISTVLDELSQLDFPYFLEVCSPGAERELRDIEEIYAALNEHVYVKLKNPQNGIFELTGDLKSVNNDEIMISYRDKTREKTLLIQTENIAFIRLAIKF
ncbi:MAG: ribosome maturation factor RimP [Erysipelotrichaceae bacterium]|nr:ribosome maturation factor RimP [Erysipelotrichaceae bacterium]